MDGYKDKLIVFIDILGFSNMVNDSENDNAKFESILELVSDLQNTIVKKYEFEHYHEGIMQMSRKYAIFSDGNEEYINPNKFEYAMFSDCIIIILDFVKADSLVGIMTNLGLLQSKYMAKGKLIRGGITYGKIYHENSVCFGPGLVKAVELEKEAKYPRILIDKGILEGENLPEWDSEKLRYFNFLIHPWLNQDINPLALLDSNTGYYYVNPLQTQNSHDFYPSIVKSIEDNINLLIKSNENQSVIEKWLWIKEDLSNNPKVKSGQVNEKFTKY